MKEKSSAQKEMTSQTYIEEFSCGTNVCVGDIVLWNVAWYYGLSRVVIINGKLCIEDNYYYGDGIAIDVFLKGTTGIKVMSLVDVYKFCRKSGWDTGEYIKKFGK